MKKVINTNGVDRTAAAFQYLTGQGVPAWSNAIAYIPGDMSATSGNYLWRCIAGNTNKPPTSNPTFWVAADPNGERNAMLWDAYFIGPPIDYPQFNSVGSGTANYGAYPLVDGDQPITYGGAGTPITFVPFAIKKDKLAYKIGFEPSNVSIKLFPRDNIALYQGTTPMLRGDGKSFSEGLQVAAPYADAYACVSSSGTNGIYLLESLKQSFAQTDWYLAPITIFRFIIPPPQDGNTLDVVSYGAAVMFRGRLSDFTVDKEEVSLTGSSLMEIFKQKVPSQTIQPGNRWAPFDFKTNPDFVGSANPTTGSYEWATLGFSGVPTSGQLAEGWALVSVDAGINIGEWWRRIYQNVTSGSNSTIYFLDPLPINLQGQQVTCRIWMSGQTSTNPSGPGAGFPYVPQPLTGIS